MNLNGLIELTQKFVAKDGPKTETVDASAIGLTIAKRKQAAIEESKRKGLVVETPRSLGANAYPIGT